MAATAATASMEVTIIFVREEVFIIFFLFCWCGNCIRVIGSNTSRGEPTLEIFVK